MRFTPAGILDATFVGSACVTPEGCALAVGTVGEYVNDLRAAAFRFDARARTWSAVKPPPALVATGPGALVALLDGVVACIAGRAPGYPRATTLATLFLYDSKCDTWTEARALSTPREYFAASVLQDGSLLVTGGRGADQVRALATAERYIPHRDEWVPIARLPEARAEHAAAVLEDGRVLVAGGVGPDGFRHPGASTATFLYSPGVDDWTQTGPLAHARKHHALVALPDGHAATFGGWSGREHELDSIEVFDSSAKRWNSGGALLQLRERAAAALLLDGSVIIAGGGRAEKDRVLVFADTETWVSSTGTSRLGPRLCRARTGLCLLSLGAGRLLAVGGIIGAKRSGANATEMLDPS